MAYLGSTPTTQSFISGTDYFNGTGSQTAFTLTRSVASVNDIQAVVNNVVQVPNDAYTLSGTTITFTSAPSSGTNNVYVRYLSTTTQVITPSQNSVGTAQLASLTTIPVAGGYTVTLPSATGTAMVSGNMPAFSAYIGTDQTITASVNTKIAFNTEEYDTASRYNNTGSTVGGIPAYAFLPNVAGYYFINLNFWIGSSTGTYTRWNGKIFKNGSEYSRINDLVLSGGYGTAGGCLIYLNGSTDYVEAYANIGTNGTAIMGAGGTVVNLFQGYMVRAA